MIQNKRLPLQSSIYPQVFMSTISALYSTIFEAIRRCEYGENCGYSELFKIFCEQYPLFKTPDPKIKPLEFSEAFGDLDAPHTIAPYVDGFKKTQIG